ncbi:AAA family ATPase [Streptomyces sp. NBC_01237]|uniref:AAA family ATPase n=2 Tax=Streptomyces TaxID=1883 RepID=UPI002DD7FA52|nr:AAA family ATPase [Streptomyces sp. NBC_01237]WRZ77728.1 ATP-binding protein [Streptomyces sp. NBC_01237]
MIVWLNGAFGVGKSTLATGLRKALDGAVIADPEGVGSLLQEALDGHKRHTGDYQDHPPWRHLTLAFITNLANYTGGPVIVPMTVLDPRHATDLFTPLRRRGPGFHHLVLHAGPDALRQRIADSDDFPGEAVRAFRQRRAADYQAAADSWMHAQGHVINTSALTAGQTLQAALAHLHTTDPTAQKDPHP